MSVGYTIYGCIVKEATDDVHAAIQGNKILKVQFERIKYMVHYKNQDGMLDL